MENRVGIGLYGENGHQISGEMIERAGGELIGVCKMNPDKAGDTESGTVKETVAVYENLQQMLEDARIQMISVCSPKRADQAEDIKKILRAGKHVYAEKPCVMKRSDLDEILEIAKQDSLLFCEMAGTFLEQPYAKVREIAEYGILGEIVQIFAQKSYPYGEWRPQDEEVDGGLLLQNAIYGLRFIEQIAGQEITEIFPMETGTGNPKPGNLCMAASFSVRLKNGGIGSVIANYLNQPSFGIWGNEELRIFGTKGFLKTNCMDQSIDLYTEKEQKHYETSGGTELLQVLVSCIREGKPLPFSQEWLVHPTRKALEAKEKLQ